MSKPWKGRGYPSRDKSPQVLSWLYATSEESLESPFNQAVLSRDSGGKGAAAPLSSTPLWIHKENTIYLDCKSGAGDRQGGSLNHNSQGIFYKAHREKAMLRSRGRPPCRKRRTQS